jgi:hypothetical protein
MKKSYTIFDIANRTAKHLLELDAVGRVQQARHFRGLFHS